MWSRLRRITSAHGAFLVQVDYFRVARHSPTTPVMPPPPDLAGALGEVDLEETFARLPVEKQNHIILWIEEAARPRNPREASLRRLRYRPRKSGGEENCPEVERFAHTPKRYMTSADLAEALSVSPHRFG
jgi:hypothetical protein